MSESEVKVMIEADAMAVHSVLGLAQRQQWRLAIVPVVEAWCPDLNQYAKRLFIIELLDAITPSTKQVDVATPNRKGNNVAQTDHD